MSGRKLGFTNRTIWPEYGVYTPVWGYTWDHSVHDAPAQKYNYSLTQRLEPRIEPEIVFGLRRDLTSDDRSVEAILDAMQWYAHGFEIAIESTLSKTVCGISP